MISVMLDLETLSLANDAAIISIGVAKFDGKQVTATDGWALDMGGPHGPSKVFGHVDPATVAWWMKQSEPAREFSFTGKVDPHVAAQGLTDFMRGCDEIWANDPEFDVVVLRTWWQALRPRLGKFPMSYKQSRSYRTIMAEAKACAVDIDGAWHNGFVAHNPIEDAATQARAVMLARQGLRAGRELYA